MEGLSSSVYYFANSNPCRAGSVFALGIPESGTISFKVLNGAALENGWEKVSSSKCGSQHFD